MGNVKISELPYASRIDDDALVVLVQDHANCCMSYLHIIFS